jgi:hypothetical protein
MGLLMLLLGVLVYLTARPAETVPGLLTPLSVSHAISGDWKHFTNSIPTFAHTAAFILLMMALLKTRPRRAAVICTLWLLLEALFEVGQHEAVSASFAAAVPDWWEELPGLQGTRGYFLRGTFDPLDLVSIGFGGLVAYFFILAEYVRRHNGH